MPKLLKLLLISAFFNALSWTVLIPIWQYPDEQAHFAQVQNRAEAGGIIYPPFDTSMEIILTEEALGTYRDGFGNNKYTYHPEFNIEYSNSRAGLVEESLRNLPLSARTEYIKKEATLNPPLYYSIGSYFYKAVNSESIFERVFALRLFSVILFMLLILTAYKTSQILFKKNNYLQYSLTALVAFMPMLVFSSTGILPDPLTNLLFSLTILISLLIIEKGIKFKYLFFAILIIIAGSLTRQQFLIALPIFISAIIFSFFIKRSLKQLALLSFFILIIIMLGFTLPSLWYIKQISLPEVGQIDLKLFFANDFLNYLKTFALETYNRTFAWYWGVYRWLSLTLPPIIYLIIKSIVLLGFIGIIIKIIKDIAKGNIKKDIYFYFLITASLIYIAIIVIWDYYFRLGHGFSFGIQGRYLFPLIIAHLSLLIIGLKTVLETVYGKYADIGIYLVVLLMMVFNLYTLFFVSGSYYDTSSIGNLINQASQYKAQFVKGNIIIFLISANISAQLLFAYSLAKNAFKKNFQN